MFKTASEVVAYIKENDVKFLDVRFTDLPGVQQHFNLPASMIDEEFFVDGQFIDSRLRLDSRIRHAIDS